MKSGSTAAAAAGLLIPTTTSRDHVQDIKEAIPPFLVAVTADRVPVTGVVTVRQLSPMSCDGRRFGRSPFSNLPAATDKKCATSRSLRTTGLAAHSVPACGTSRHQYPDWRRSDEKGRASDRGR